jgi:hypothetical protein
LNGGHSVVIDNLWTDFAGRSLYATNVEGLDAKIVSTRNQYTSDILLTAESLGNYTTNRFTDATIRYSRKDTTATGAPVILRLEKPTGGTGGAVASNITLIFNVDAPCGNLFEMYRSVDLTEDFGPARGHIVDGLYISGRAVGLAFGAGIVLHAMPAGETIRNVEIYDFLGRTANNDFPITIDGTAFDSPLVLCDVDIDGVLTLTNFAAGMLHLHNVNSANFKTSAEPTLTWGQVSGVGPALGNGTLVARYEREGASIKLDATLTTGSTTTYGDGSEAWFFTLPAPYNASPRSSAIGTVFAVRAGNVIHGLALFAPSTNRIFLYADATFGWKQGVPGAWAAGDTITFSVEYTV